ncbi:MAG: SDR family oxidoreductase [Sphingobacteriales bacterium]|nr:MAG: SDR family oxidoreductase [Sphingobacteriales bacterium]
MENYFNNAIAGKKIIVTGGTTGIGRGIAILLNSLGAKCLICGRNQEQLDETLAILNSANQSESVGLTVDLARAEEVKKLFEFADKELGEIDILINNAAIGYGSVLDGEYEDWQYVINTNLLAYLACSKEAIKRMEASGGGQIVNIGSMSADVREEKSSVYVATKAGIQGFSDSLRKEINAKGIKLTLIEPGAVDTDMQEAPAAEKSKMIANQEMIKAEDIARAVMFCIAQPEACEIVDLKIRPHMQII